MANTYDAKGIHGKELLDFGTEIAKKIRTDDEVIAASLNNLNSRLEAFENIENWGDILADSINTSEFPMVAGKPMVVVKAGTPSGTSTIPDYAGQFYVDSTNKVIYCSGGYSSVNDWVDVTNKIGTGTVGSATKPIYLNSGTPTAGSDYAGGTKVTLNGTDKGASTATIYAPTTAGTNNYVLKSNGSGEPSWVEKAPKASAADTATTATDYNTSSGTIKSGLDSKVNIANISLNSQTTTLLEQVRNMVAAGTHYARFFTTGDASSANISDKPVSGNSGFLCEVMCNRGGVAGSTDYRYLLTCWVKDDTNPFVAVVTQNTTTISWDRLNKTLSHSHGNITNAGAIGSTSDNAVYTTTNGVLTAGSLASNDPTASGTTITAIDTLSQDAKGKVTATKKTIRSATTSQSGIVQLNDNINSTSTTEAATANAVKKAYDKANGKQDPITFDGTYNASTNKAATVSTVTTAVSNAVNGLDATVTSSDGTNVQVKVTETDGKITAVNVTTDNTANKTHAHGNIQSGGTLQTDDVTIASGDKLVITDSSDSSKVARASISFDGSTTTKALTQKGTFEAFAKAADITNNINSYALRYASARLEHSTPAGAGWYKMAEYTGVSQYTNAKGVFQYYVSTDSYTYSGEIYINVRGNDNTSLAPIIRQAKIVGEAADGTGAQNIKAKLAVVGITGTTCKIQLWIYRPASYSGVVIRELQSGSYTLSNTAKWTCTSYGSSAAGSDAPVTDASTNTNVVDFTVSNPAYESNVVHTTGNESISGVKTFNSDIILDTPYRDSYYARNLCRFFSSELATQVVIKTKFEFFQNAYMPVIYMYGFNYTTGQVIDLALTYYIYNNDFYANAMYVVSRGAWKPTCYLFKYTENNVDYVAIGISTSQIRWGGISVDAQIGGLGSFSFEYLSIDGWSTTSNAGNTSTTIIPAVGTDKCVEVPYRSLATDISGNSSSTSKLATTRELAVNLANTSATSNFDGSASQTGIKVSGKLADANISSAATWNAKQNALPTSGTASTTYAVNISGNAATATSATSAGKLSSAKKLAVNLANTSTDSTFDGSADQTGIKVSGTLPVANGGTGLTESPSMLTNLGSTSAANVFAASPRPGVTGTLPIANGGTGATTAANARSNLSVYSKSEVDSMLTGRISIVTSLPATGEAGVIYFVGPTGSGSDKYEEYVWDGSAFVKVGEKSLDLSNYVNTLTTTGSGNAITAISKSGNTITATIGNVTFTQPQLGQGYGTCSTAEATAAKAVTLSDFVLKNGGIVAVKFTYALCASATLDVNSTGAKPVLIAGAAPTSSTCKAVQANDIAYFIYDGTSYHLLGTERASRSSITNITRSGTTFTATRADGSTFTFTQQDNNTTYTQEKLGQGYGTCTTAEATAAKAVSLTNYELVTNGVIAVKFTYGLCASATLNVNSKGAKPIYIHGAAVTSTTAKEVLAGDIALFMYDGSQYQFLCSDRLSKDAIAGLSISGKTITYTKADGTTGTLTTQDTTYTFDGTYDSSTNKAATVSTVTNKIAALDVSDISGFGAGKTLATLTETDGKIAATFQNISITKSQVSDFPSSMTPTSHAHGNIQNGGTLQATDVAIASGDKLVVTDASDSNKVARTSVSFDGSTTTKALTQKGTFESFVKAADITAAIQLLDVTAVGGAGKYISAISETDGKIAATVTSMDTAPTASSTNAVTSGGVKTALDGKAPTSHASSATTYGVGTTANYGHVKLATGDMNGATHADGVAVSKNHTHSQYQTVLTEMTETEVDNLLAVLT